MCSLSYFLVKLVHSRKFSHRDSSLKLADWNNSSLPPRDAKLKRPPDCVLKLRRNKQSSLSFADKLKKLQLRRKRNLTLTLQLLRVKGGDKLKRLKLLRKLRRTLIEPSLRAFPSEKLKLSSIRRRRKPPLLPPPLPRPIKELLFNRLV